MAKTKKTVEKAGQYVYKHSKILLDIEVVVSTLTTEAQYLVDQLELEYKKMVATGTPASSARASVIAQVRDGSGIMQAWVNKQNRIINELTKSMVAAPVNDAAALGKSHWVLGAVKTSHCPDCLHMAEISEADGPKTIAAWRKYGVGLPREGKTQCSYGCRCMLLPAAEKQEAA